MNELRRLIPYFRPYRRGMLLGLLLVVVSNLFMIAGPYLLQVAIDAMEENLSRALIFRYAGLIILVALLGGVARYGMRELLNGISRRIERDLRDDLFHHLSRLPVQFYDEWRTGDLISRATNDVYAVRQVAGPAIMYLVNTATISTLAIGFMVATDPRLTLYSVIPLALLPVAVVWFGRKIHTRFERIQAKFSDISSFVQENLAGIRIVKAYAREYDQTEQFDRLNREYLDRNMDMARIWGAFRPTLNFFGGVAAVVALGYGGLQVVRGNITEGQYVAFFFYLTLLSWPMISLGWVTNLFQRGAASMERINELFEVEPAIADPPEPVALGEAEGAVEFRHVWFSYPGSDEVVLRDISFRAEPGQTVAVVGGTGSGKTTLVRLLPRLYDVTRGAVRLDGVDIRNYRVEDLRRQISVVPQEPFLFSTRLRRNILLPDGPDPSDEPGAARRDDAASRREAALERSLEIAHLTETLDVLPDGLDTVLGERGVNLSGGQKQRATLARAVHRNAPILILDDALSAVDTVTETEILEGLSRYLEGRTALIVSHRVSAVRDADRILVLEAGEIVERGTHRELLELDGAYAQLLERQLLEEEVAREQVVGSGGGA
jgi:ATP-binding cassette subfamily B protein